MTRKSRQTSGARNRPESTEAGGHNLPERLAYSLGLALAVLVVVCRLSFPSEDAGTGSGALYVVLSLASAFLVALGGRGWLRSPRASIPFSALCLWLFLAAFRADYRFPAEILAWEWAAVGILAFTLARQVPWTGLMPWIALLSALAIAQSSLAVWQIAVDFPAMRRQYERSDPAFIEELRAIGIEPGTTGERLFRDRLYASEPFGAFGHPNSLAGLLVLVLPLIVATFFGARRPSARWLGALMTVLVLAALLLSKSRSAWLAVGLQALLAVCLGRWLLSRLPHPRLRLAGSILGLALLVGSLAALGKLDRLVVTESLKSLSYRIEWWRGSVPLIAGSPFFGVGLGNFAAQYPRHKLPFSSEEITDPHNFMIELAASGGLPAAILYLAALCLGLAAIWRNQNRVAEACREQTTLARLPHWWWVGSVAGLVLVLLLEPPGHFGLIGGAFALAAFGIIATISRGSDGVSPSALHAGAFLGVLGLHVHWLAAGGVGFPSLLLPCWILVATAAASPTPESAKATLARRLSIVGPLLLGTLFITTQYLPLVRRDQIRLTARMTNEAEQTKALCAEAEALPGDQAGWLRLAEWHFAVLASSKGSASRPRERQLEDYRAAQMAFSRAIALEPARAATFARLGDLHALASELGLDPEAAARRAEAWSAAVERYPNLASGRFQFGMALLATNRTDDAADQFRLALDLDRSPHPDKKLSPAQREAAQKYATPHSP